MEKETNPEAKAEKGQKKRKSFRRGEKALIEREEEPCALVGMWNGTRPLRKIPQRKKEQIKSIKKRKGGFKTRGDGAGGGRNQKGGGQRRAPTGETGSNLG